jgi:ABC-2 type transport system permease protein
VKVETSHRDLPLVGRQVVAEQKMFWRNPAAAGFTIIFPLFFLIIFSLLNGTGDIALPSGIVVRFTSYYIAGIIVFAAVSACFTNLAINLTMRRDDGTLKRKRSTPLPTWALFAGLLGSQLIVTVLMALFTTALSMAFFHVRLPQHLLEFLGVVLLSAATLCSLGVAITALIPNQDAAPAVVNIIAFPLLFLSGLFFPVGKGTLHDIAQWLPLARMQHAIFDSFAPAVRHCQAVRGCSAPVLHSSGPVAADIAVILVWLAIGTLVSLRTFRWVKKGE